jgi:hypothetical protein
MPGMSHRSARAFFVLVCFGATARSAAVSRLAATVGDRAITVRDVLNRVRLASGNATAAGGASAAGDPLPHDPAERRAAWQLGLAAAVNWAVLLEAAEREKLAIPRAALDRSLRRARTRPWSDEHRRRVRVLGLDEAGERRDFVDRLLVRALVARHIEPVKPQDVAAWYRAHRARLGEPERRRISVISVLITPQRTRAEARQRINSIRAKLDAGNDFGELAKSMSDEPGLELGPISLHSGSVFAGDAFRLLKPGDVSTTVETSKGLHILRLDSILPARPARFKDVEESIRERLTDERIAEGLSDLAARWRRRVQIRVLAPAPPPPTRRVRDEPAIP